MSDKSEAAVLSGSMTALEGEERDLGSYVGNVVLVVNTASKCGLTPQFEGLQRIYEEHHEKGFEVLGFPANNFMDQEPGTDSEIGEFCQKNYGVTFPMFAKTDVVGDATNPLFARLTAASEAPEWNFAKYLIGRDGNLVAKFPAGTEPEDPDLVAAIGRELA
ncbi:MAG: glutathione peroxidase [Solirubrobacterales bacterium]